jgi:hypothetical protein
MVFPSGSSTMAKRSHLEVLLLVAAVRHVDAEAAVLERARQVLDDHADHVELEARRALA